jgi:aminomethyltransferase
VTTGARSVGFVTSGTFSFTLEHGIATASVDPDLPAETPLAIEIRGASVPAERVPLPFYRRTKGA